VFYVWDERQFAVKDNAQELSILYTGTGVPFSRRVGSGWGFVTFSKDSPKTRFTYLLYINVFFSFASWFIIDDVLLLYFWFPP